MKKIILLLCIILTILITGCSNSNKETDNRQIQTNIIEDSNLDIDITMALTPTEKPTITPEITKVVNVEDNELLNSITELCKSPRRFDTDGEQRALNFLNDKMTEYGYQTRTQEFYVYEKTLNDMYSATPWQYFNKYSGEKNSIGKGINLIITTANPDKKKPYISLLIMILQETLTGLEIIAPVLQLLWKLPVNYKV
jgi:hypothetical protein